MPIHSVTAMLRDASENKYALGAFVCMNLEMVNAAIAAAEDEDAPVLVRVHPKLRRATRLSTIAAVTFEHASRSRVPIGLSLDHGADLADIADAVHAGFNAVMLDASERTLEENVALVTRAVEFARPIGVAVEAAAGRMPHGRAQTSGERATEREAAALARTGIDLLAPAVGNVHGTAHGETKTRADLDFYLMRRLRDAAGVPLCLHGGSAIGPADARAAIDAGVHAVIIFTDVVTAFNREIRRVLDANPDGIDVIEALEPAQAAAKEVIAAKLRMLGSSGRARGLLARTPPVTRAAPGPSPHP